MWLQSVCIVASRLTSTIFTSASKSKASSKTDKRQIEVQESEDCGVGAVLASRTLFSKHYNKEYRQTLSHNRSRKGTKLHLWGSLVSASAGPPSWLPFRLSTSSSNTIVCDVGSALGVLAADAGDLPAWLKKAVIWRWSSASLAFLEATAAALLAPLFRFGALAC